jgi:hypothetical protein
MPFQKGQSGNPSGARREKVYANASLLEDMRHVRSHPKSEDISEGQKGVRKWMESDPKGFYKEMAAQERTEREAEARKQPGEEPDRDEGLERALATCEEWLKNWAVQHPEGYR